MLDSVVRGYTTDLRGSAGPMGSASLNIDYSAFDFSKLATNTPQATINPGLHNLNLGGLDPRLIDVRGACGRPSTRRWSIVGYPAAS